MNSKQITHQSNTLCQVFYAVELLRNELKEKDSLLGDELSLLEELNELSAKVNEAIKSADTAVGLARKVEFKKRRF